jgi:mono/diheme cytochrome c family protein
VRRAATVICLIFVLSPKAVSQDTREIVNQETSRAVVRGGSVYKTYCALCHGERGDGSGRAATADTRSQLVVKPHSRKYYDSIIRRGSHGASRMPAMPAWQYDLSEEQLEGVVEYTEIVHDPVVRGEVVYKTNCLLCHGVKADGKGRAAVLFKPAPSDLTHTDKDDGYKLAIIRRGGKAMGRSSKMPAWKGRLTRTEIEDVVQYLRSVQVGVQREPQ